MQCGGSELQNLTTTPTLVQSGTVFDNAATALRLGNTIPPLPSPARTTR